MRHVWRVVRCVVQRKIKAFLVAANQPARLPLILPVVGVILVTVTTRRNAVPCLRGLMRVECPCLGGGFAGKQQNQLLFRAGALAGQKKTPIGFGENGRGAAVAKLIAVQLMRTVCVV